MNKLIEILKYTFVYDLIFPIVQALQVFTWYLKDAEISTPHLVKQRVVKDYAKKYRIQTFIETGTYLGAMINATKNTFKKIYTIELDKKLYLHTKNKFKKFNHIKIYLGDSTKILPKLLKTIRKPSLFWLDAHYSKGITAKGEKVTPILEELTSILNHKVKSHTILIDDASNFIGRNDYPTLKYLRNFVARKNPNLDFEVEYDIIRIFPNNFGQWEHK